MRASLAALVSIIFGSFSVAVDGHHSAAPIFDTGKLVVVEGIVTEVWFENPHSRYYVQVRSQDGGEVLWEAETMNANWFLRRGWDETTVQTGDQVSLNGYPARNGSNVFLLRNLIRDNKTLYRWTRLDGDSIAADQEGEKCIIVFGKCTD